MAQIASAASVLLSFVLTFAAVAKLRDRAATQRSFRQLGLRFPGGMAVAVPLIELIVAAALLVRPDIGGFVALGLFVAFTALLIPVVRNRRVVSCGCFGSNASAPVTSTTIARNGAFIVAALIATFTDRVRLDWPGVIAVGASTSTVILVLALSDLRRTTGTLFGFNTSGRSG